MATFENYEIFSTYYFSNARSYKARLVGRQLTSRVSRVFTFQKRQAIFEYPGYITHLQMEKTPSASLGLSP